MAYPQTPQELKEIDEAIENAQSGNFQQTIPVLEKYIYRNDFDDLKILEINVYLNLCYLATGNNSFNLNNVNLQTDTYITKYGISKSDTIKLFKETELLHSAAIINTNVNNHEKVVYYLLLIKNHYEENNPLYQQSFQEILGLLAQAYYNLSDFSSAIKIGLEAYDINREFYGEKNINSLKILEILYYSYQSNNELKKALECLQKTTELSKDLFGENNPEYIASLNDLAIGYLEIGNYKKALETNLNSIELAKMVLGAEHQDYFTCLNNLSVIYSKLGDYKKALEIDLMVSESRKEILGEKHPDYLLSLINLAASYNYLGESQKALNIVEIVKSNKEILGEKSIVYQTSLNNLSSIYSKLGDYKKALEIDLMVSESRKEILGEKHPDYLRSMNNLAISYSRLGNFQKALEINLKVIEKRKEVLGETHPEYIRSLHDLSIKYSNMGEYQKALNLLLDIIEKDKEILGEYHPDYFTTLNNLALIYSDIGDYEKSLELNSQIIEKRKEVLGETHPDYLLTLSNLAITEINLLQTYSALNHYFEFLIKTQVRVSNYFSLMTEYQRTQYWNINSKYFEFFPMFLEKEIYSLPKYIKDAFNFALFSKGLLLNTTIDFEKLISESGTPETIAKFEELKLLKLQIQRLQEKPFAERYLNVDSLENIAQQKETELVKLSKEYGDYTQNLKITWEDVQNNLSDNDVAIEFVEYPALTDTVKYAALLLRKDWQYPKMIPLFCKDQIEEFIIQDEDKIYSYGYVGKQMKKLLWEPLEEFISPGEHVYFSPAGIIHQLAIENFAWNDSTILSERYQMHRLSSTKELVVQQPESNNHSAVVYGGLYFKLDTVDMIAGSKKFETPDDLFALVRGYPNDYSERSGWDTIYGTRLEAEQINLLLSDKNYQVDLYTGKAGIEESFKALSGKKNGIIHIATHGFFLPIEESRQNPFVMQRIGDDQPAKATIDPMLRSGLIMAGGNKAWLGEDIPDNVEDGVLTAKEISHIDLRGTDMVVLSACKTGLGEVSSEGVFGLQRSFKQAGVKTIVMSLWKVNDEATKYMMTEFYASLLSGKEKREAFLEAKQKCREEYIDPQYWAAFIMLN